MDSQNSSKKSRSGWIILVVVLVILGIVLLIFLFRQKKSNQQIQPTDGSSDGKEYTYDSFLEAVRKEGVPDSMAKLLTAQAAHETGNFTSSVFLNDNNAFGMHFPEKRNTLAIDKDANNYCIYNNVEDSIRDMLVYLTFVGIDARSMSVDQYVTALKEHDYFTDSYVKYLSAMKKHLNTIG